MYGCRTEKIKIKHTHKHTHKRRPSDRTNERMRTRRDEKREERQKNSGNKDTYTTIGGDLSTPTYMSAHIFDWMNDSCCTRMERISLVREQNCTSLEASDACYNYRNQT